MSKLSISGMTYFYPGSSEPSLKEIDFLIEAPAAVAFVGPNLAGKTTLASILVRSHLGQLSGSVTGEIAIELKRRNGIGLLLEDTLANFCNLHVDEEVAFGLENQGIDVASMEVRIRELLGYVGLQGFERRQITTLSGGEMQKLAIAALLAMDPEIVLTDDLLSNVDVASSPKLVELMFHYQERSQAIWIDMSRQWRDHISIKEVGLLSAGELLYLGEPEAGLLQSGRDYLDSLALPEHVEVALALREIYSGASVNLFDRNAVFAQFCRIAKPKINRSFERSKESNYSFQAEGIWFSYARGVHVLKDACLYLAKGKINILAGRNGSGKSTIARLLGGLARPAKGEIKFMGRKQSVMDLRRLVCMVFQNPEYHFLCDTVEEEVLLAYRMKGLNGYPTEVLEDIGLEGRESESVFALTSGEKRRLAIGLGLIRGAELLILDEPTLGQDGKQTKKLGSLFRSLADRGVTVLIISHDSRLIYSYGDSLSILEKGSISYSGPVPAAFCETSSSDFAGLSDVLNMWVSIGGSPDCMAAPRSASELIEMTELPTELMLG